MMTVAELQDALRRMSIDVGPIDDRYGKQTRAAVMEAMTDGPDTRLTALDFAVSAARLGVDVAAIRAVDRIESAGGGDRDGDGRPDILFEGHRFSRATAHRFDASHPNCSWPTWDRTRYPVHQSGRYAQLLEAVGLNVDAGFASASYGRFQILGENHARCGYATPFGFAVAMAQDEQAQLAAFEAFLDATGLVEPLRRLDFDAFADGYNGAASRVNRYAERLRAEYQRLKGGAA